MLKEFKLFIDIINKYISLKRSNKDIKNYNYIDFYTTTLQKDDNIKAYKNVKLVISYIDIRNNKSYELTTMSKDILINDKKELTNMIEEAGVYLICLLESFVGEQIINGTYEGL